MSVRDQEHPRRVQLGRKRERADARLNNCWRAASGVSRSTDQSLCATLPCGERAAMATRKLAAILAADVVGYSRLAGSDEERTLARLRALRSDLIDPAIAAHHGRVVKRTRGRQHRRVSQRRRWRALRHRSPERHGRAQRRFFKARALARLAGGGIQVFSDKSALQAGR
jgi:hypothetical protein